MHCSVLFYYTICAQFLVAGVEILYIFLVCGWLYIYTKRQIPFYRDMYKPMTVLD